MLTTQEETLATKWLDQGRQTELVDSVELVGLARSQMVQMLKMSCGDGAIRIE